MPWRHISSPSPRPLVGPKPSITRRLREYRSTALCVHRGLCVLILPSVRPAPSMFRSSRDAASTYSSFQRPESYVGNQEIMTVIRPGSTHHSQSLPLPSQPQSQLQSPPFNRPAFPREQSVPVAHSPPFAQWGRYAPSEAELIKELYRSRG